MQEYDNHLEIETFKIMSESLPSILHALHKNSPGVSNSWVQEYVEPFEMSQSLHEELDGESVGIADTKVNHNSMSKQHSLSSNSVSTSSLSLCDEGDSHSINFSLVHVDQNDKTNNDEVSNGYVVNLVASPQNTNQVVDNENTSFIIESEDEDQIATSDYVSVPLSYSKGTASDFIVVEDDQVASDYIVTEFEGRQVATSDSIVAPSSALVFEEEHSDYIYIEDSTPELPTTSYEEATSDSEVSLLDVGANCIIADNNNVIEKYEGMTATKDCPVVFEFETLISNFERNQEFASSHQATQHPEAVEVNKECAVSFNFKGSPTASKLNAEIADDYVVELHNADSVLDFEVNQKPFNEYVNEEVTREDKVEVSDFHSTKSLDTINETFYPSQSLANCYTQDIKS